ncbi:hypothetical protein C8J56DRAFT_886605 [Mycena floridula]|nr:hypothetical protein C8J56DRAFT_886605 [Mycena floridula]
MTKVFPGTKNGSSSYFVKRILAPPIDNKTVDIFAAKTEVLVTMLYWGVATTKVTATILFLILRVLGLELARLATLCSIARTLRSTWSVSARLSELWLTRRALVLELARLSTLCSIARTLRSTCVGASIGTMADQARTTSGRAGQAHPYSLLGLDITLDMVGSPDDCAPVYSP